MPDTTNSLSFTAMLGKCKESFPSITRHQLLSFLQDTQYILDIRTPTEFGLSHGISILSKDGTNGSWPVYDETIQLFVMDHLEEISNISTLSTDSPVPEELSNQFIQYPVLKLPDSFVVVAIETTGSDIDDEIVELCIMNNDQTLLYHNFFLPEKENENVLKNDCPEWKKQVTEATPISLSEVNHVLSLLQNKTIVTQNREHLKAFFIQTLLRHQLPTSEFKALFHEAKEVSVFIDTYLELPNSSLQYVASKLHLIKEVYPLTATDTCLLSVRILNELEHIMRIRTYDFIKTDIQNSNASVVKEQKETPRIEPFEVSLPFTKLYQLVKPLGITKKALETRLIEKNYISDRKTPTEYGLSHGVSERDSGYSSTPYLIYGPNIQQELISSFQNNA